MSGTSWFGPSGKQFNFGRRGGGGNKTEYLLAAGLGVVIIAALGLTIWGMFGGRIGGPRAPSELWFKCEKCGHDLSVSLKDMAADTPSAMMEIEFSQKDCPSCGAKKSCWESIECPSCHKRYISQSKRAHIAAMMSGRGDPEGVQDICPYCRTNFLEWHRQHMNK